MKHLGDRRQAGQAHRRLILSNGTAGGGPGDEAGQLLVAATLYCSQSSVPTTQLLQANYRGYVSLPCATLVLTELRNL
jgi:hypothetical protein